LLYFVPVQVGVYDYAYHRDSIPFVVVTIVFFRARRFNLWSKLKFHAEL
jgi:hypothetical protein